MMSNPKKVMIIYHSIWGHVETLAKNILEGVNKVDGVKGSLWRVPETLNTDILTKMQAVKLDDDIPILTYEKMDEMLTADGFMFGMPTRFGIMSSQLKNLFDATGKYWMQGSFVGKPAGLFFSTSTQGGGQETTALTAVTQLTHHGMCFVPLGYTYGTGYYNMDEVRGGSPYGSGTYSGPDNKRKPTELELKIALHQGEQFAKFVKRLN
jgi:NAD(P)H dehydrogenase (quinone)